MNLRFSSLILLALLGSFSTVAHADEKAGVDLGGIQLFSALDLVSDFGIENPPTDSGRLRVRSFEIAVSAPIDTLFDAVVNVAGHDEAGVIEIELHEGYIETTRLLPRTRLKAGRFLLGFGRLNQFHSHDWPFTSAPIVQSRFFADEAVIDSGMEAGYLLDTEIPIDIVAGTTNGWTFGHSHTGGRRPLVATHYLHPTIFFDLNESRGLLLGLSYIGRTDADSVQMRIAGLDLVYKKRVGRKIETLVQSEFYHRTRSSSSLALEEDLGGYVFVDQSLGDSGWSFGVRLDGYSNLSLKFQNGDTRSNFELGLMPVASYKVSEFSTLRASYVFINETRQGDAARNEQRIELQLVALMGAHPAHEF